MEILRDMLKYELDTTILFTPDTSTAAKNTAIQKATESLDGAMDLILTLPDETAQEVFDKVTECIKQMCRAMYIDTRNDALTEQAEKQQEQ